MAYEALYTRTRPKCLAQLVGQEHISIPLTRAVNQDRLAHAYLLVGTRGTGKTSTARLLARAVNCQTVADAQAERQPLTAKEIPCGHCDSCLNFDRSPDNIEFDAASNRSVDDIGRLLSTVYLAPMQSRVKTFIIDEVHMLSFEAVNSILKLIEEPPDNVIFFLATTEYNKVPLTIRSRCQILNFKLISQERIADYLTRLGERLKLDIEPDAARKLARLARGSMRDAMTLVDQCYSMTDEKTLTLQLVDDTLGLIADSDLDDLITAVRDKDRRTVSTLTAKVLASGITAVEFAEELITGLRDRIVKLERDQSDEFIFLERMIDRLRKAAVEMRASGIADIILETTLLKFTSDVVEAPVVISSIQAAPPVVEPASTPQQSASDDEIKKLRAELDINKDTPARKAGKRLVDVLRLYFGKGKHANIVSMLDTVQAAEFEDDRLVLTFQTNFNSRSFDDNYRASIESTLRLLIENPSATIETRSIEPPPQKKQSAAEIAAKSKPKTRKNILMLTNLFGEIKLDNTDDSEK